MKASTPVLRCVRLAASLGCACLCLSPLPSTSAEKEKPARLSKKPTSSPPDKSVEPLRPPAPSVTESQGKAAKPEDPAALESICAAIEPFTLRTELARPLGDGKQTVLTPAREDKVLGITNYSKEEFAAAGLDWDQFLAKAADAATRLLVSITPRITKAKDGTIAYVTLRSERPFAASIVLSPRLIPLFREQFGDRLVVLMPDRNTVYVFSRNFGEFQDFGPRIIKEYSEALYPCSMEAFEVSRDGLKCLGAFDDGAGSSPPPGSASKAEGKSSRIPPGSDAGTPSREAGKKPPQSNKKKG